MDKIYDLIIIGSGPAGLSAAIYGVRAKLDLLVIEREMMSGGQVVNTYEVDNYPGLPGISGFDMAMKFREHAEQLGAEFVNDSVKELIPGEDGIKRVVCEEAEYAAKTVIIASGAHHSLLGVPGEAEFSGMGVSYCATCDGAFYKNKVTAVVGGGDVALEDAIFSVPCSSFASPPSRVMVFSTAFTAMLTSVLSAMSSGRVSLPFFTATCTVLRWPSFGV